MRRNGHGFEGHEHRPIVKTHRGATVDPCPQYTLSRVSAALVGSLRAHRGVLRPFSVRTLVRAARHTRAGKRLGAPSQAVQLGNPSRSEITMCTGPRCAEWER